MNTVSLVLNGRTAAEIALMPEKQRSGITMLSSRMITSSPSASPKLSPRRPVIKQRRSSRESPGWYNTDGGMTLDDFARRLNTTTKRVERWQGACAQNVVMALMRPTPIVVFVFHPLSLAIWIAMALWLYLSANTNGSGPKS